MARAGLVHYERSWLKREFQEGQEEWKHLNRHLHVLNKVSFKLGKISSFFLGSGVLSLKGNE